MRGAQIDPTLCLLTTLSLYGLLRHLMLGPGMGVVSDRRIRGGVGCRHQGSRVSAAPRPAAVSAASRARVPAAAPISWRRTLDTRGHRLPGRSCRVAHPDVAGHIAATTDPALVAYRDGILFQQTVDRYASAWHHVKPWYYFLVEVIPRSVAARESAARMAGAEMVGSPARAGRPRRVAACVDWTGARFLLRECGQARRLPISGTTGVDNGGCPLSAGNFRAARGAIRQRRTGRTAGRAGCGGGRSGLPRQRDHSVQARIAGIRSTRWFASVRRGRPVCLACHVVATSAAGMAGRSGVSLQWCGLMQLTPQMNDQRSGTGVHGAALWHRFQRAASWRSLAAKEQFFLYLDRPVVNFGHARWMEKQREADDAARWLNNAPGTDGADARIDAAAVLRALTESDSPASRAASDGASWSFRPMPSCAARGDPARAIRYSPTLLSRIRTGP